MVQVVVRKIDRFDRGSSYFPAQNEK